jgi:hypothetical protein
MRTGTNLSEIRTLDASALIEVSAVEGGKAVQNGKLGRESVSGGLRG